MNTSAQHPAAFTAAPFGGQAGPDNPDSRRLTVLRIWFYAGVPLLIGFLLGWLQVGRTASWPRGVSLAYWLVLVVVMTATFDLGARVVAPAMRRLRAPLWLTLVVGQLLAAKLLTSPLVHAYRDWLKAVAYPAMPEYGFGTSWGEFLQYAPSNLPLWLALNLAFFHLLRMPRLGYVPRGSTLPVAAGASPASPAPEASATATTPATTTAVAPRPATPPDFLQRVRPGRRGKLLALKAEGHYLRVVTDAGSDLVLYRLSDAIAELDPAEGTQVHRSWWVAGTAIDPAVRNSSFVQLSNGMAVPVSRTYRVAARERGWLNP